MVSQGWRSEPWKLGMDGHFQSCHEHWFIYPMLCRSATISKYKLTRSSFYGVMASRTSARSSLFFLCFWCSLFRVSCVYYGDLYPNKETYDEVTAQKLTLLLEARKLYAYGPTEHYFTTHPNCVGFVRRGNEKHAGCAVILSNREEWVLNIWNCPVLTRLCSLERDLWTTWKSDRHPVKHWFMNSAWT